MCRQTRHRTIRALLDHGANINTQDVAGETPLHSSVLWCFWRQRQGYDGGYEFLGFLPRSGFDETIVNESNQTALDILLDASEGEECATLCMLLMNAPADGAWRGRGLLLLCIARHRGASLPSPDSTEILAGAEAKEPSSVEPGSSSSANKEAVDDWGGVAAWILGLGLGKEGVFRTIVGYL